MKEFTFKDDKTDPPESLSVSIPEVGLILSLIIEIPCFS